nr:hypothetical protein [Tanacetum cinerariifolium]
MFHQRECLGCGQPCDGLYCYPCTCQQCGVGLTNRICLNFTYRDGKPLTCCKCEGPLRGGFCWFCDSRVKTAFANDPNPNSFDDSQNLFDYSPKPQNETYLCEICGNDSHYGYDCPSRFPFVYEQEPCYNQNFSDNYYPHNSSSFLCCDNCGGSRENFQCLPMNHTSNSSVLDQFQPPQYFDVHQPSKEISIDELKIMMQSYWERMNQQRSKRLYLQLRKSKNYKSKQLKKRKNHHKTLTFVNLLEKFIASTPDLPNEEPDNSLSMGDEHLSTISEMESDEVIKSSVKNLVPIPSESEVTFDNDSDCDVPVNDESSPNFTTFSNPLFDCNNDFTSSDKKSLSNEDVLIIYSNSLFKDEEIIPTKIDSHYFNVESNLIKSLLNRDTLIDFSPKFDYLLKELSGELAHINPVPPGTEEVDFNLDEKICLVENLLYDNSSPRPPEELNVEISDTTIEFFSPSLIPVEDSDSQMEEIDLFLAINELMPPGIENDDYDSEGDIHFLEELIGNDTISLPENESFNFDHHDDPSFPRPPTEPLDVKVFFDFEPDIGVLTAKMVEDISKHYVLMPKVLPSQLALCPNIDTLLSFSSENEDKVFKPSILSYLLVSHRDTITFNFFENPMMMYGGDIPLLDVSYLHFYPP